MVESSTTVTYLTIYRQKRYADPEKTLNYWHMACHATLSGGTTKVLAYGEGDDINILYIKDRKKNDDEELVTSCKVNISYTELKAFCEKESRGRAWWVEKVSGKTNCQHLCEDIAERFMTPECLRLVQNSMDLRRLEKWVKNAKELGKDLWEIANKTKNSK